MYNKLFTKILDSSIWLEMTPTRIVWITLLAAMDQDGYAHFSAIENLAARARVTNDEAKAAVDCFLNPDPNSENQDYEGRRIERIPGGFIVLNASKYRELVTSAVNREQVRERVRKYRQRQSGQCNAKCNADVTQSEAVAEAVAEAVLTSNKTDTVSGLPPDVQVPKKINNHNNTARSLLIFLNEKTGRNYQPVKANLEMISARLKEGATERQCRLVVLRKFHDWGSDEKMAEYLRPATLFNRTKFAQYVGEIPKEESNG